MLYHNKKMEKTPQQDNPLSHAAKEFLDFLNEPFKVQECELCEEDLSMPGKKICRHCYVNGFTKSDFEDDVTFIKGVQS